MKLWPGLDPSRYIYNRINSKIGLMSHYEKKAKKYRNLYDKDPFILAFQVQNWIDEYVEGDGFVRRPKSLIL